MNTTERPPRKAVSDFTFHPLIYIMENKYVDGGEEKEGKKHKNVFVHIFVTSIVKNSESHSHV